MNFYQALARASSIFAFLFLTFTSSLVLADGRERISIDNDWKFSLGHATDPSKDFGHGTGYFSYLAKTGFGDGPAAVAFDDRAWRAVNIPHDWVVEQPFDGNASPSHGSKTVGPRFPQNSVGWYRHKFEIPQSDLGRRIRIEFDGIQRDSKIFVNGFLVGEEMNGNVSQSYDVSAYLNYGGNNVVVVRADVSLEAGWYYEGAGIYRHAYLLKTNPVHVDQFGTAITTDVQQDQATINIATTIINQQEESAVEKLPGVIVNRIQKIIDAKGKAIVSLSEKTAALASSDSITTSDALIVKNPVLWTLENPYLYKLITVLEDQTGKTLDTYETSFGIRTIRFDANEGFFLNGKHIKLKGSNNHEDHAGVGVALPDSLVEFRLQKLKDIGMNAYRASHAPASPTLLDLADRMGILVIQENRLMGINDLHLKAVEHMIKRDRNHPSIIIWSLGNEEWGIEGNIKGARIATTMQNFARKLDPSRMNTAAISGGWGGISATIGAAGVNYIKQANTDQQHKDYPWQILLGTEETTTQQTRGIYIEDKAKAFLPPQENGSSGGNAELGWQHYAARPYLAGIFYWTGFDYRGETTPYEYPAIGSQFGILDTCGFPKDGYYYLKSWWTNEPVLHVFPHWNWQGREGQIIDVTVNSNSEEVELLLNGKTLGKKVMPINGHLNWQVAYAPGELLARGFSKNKLTQETRVATTEKPAVIKLVPHRKSIQADGKEVAVFTVSVEDNKGRVVAVADNNIQFTIKGAGKIIGVGNGHPSSHEADTNVETTSGYSISGKWLPPKASEKTALVEFDITFDRPEIAKGTVGYLMLSALGKSQTAVLNGKTLYKDAAVEKSAIEIQVTEKSLLATGNKLHIVAQPFDDWGMRESVATVSPAAVRTLTPAAGYERRVFNGLAQVIVQSNSKQGTITLEASSEGLKSTKTDVKAF
ncbi:MAG: glycoside hydrolase family 2 protein [Gammaproteobacteria bacterium]|nr:MAG: glycoside hydrolase family 2 protein [Gammaproteobacteria bacterium]